MEPISHTPVLLQEVTQGLSLRPDDTVFDGTIGCGGHALALVQQLDADGTYIGVDADSMMLDSARKNIDAAHPVCRVSLHEDTFTNVERILFDKDTQHVNAMLLDLGWNSAHLHSGKGFSFQRDEPLEMAYSNKKEAVQFTARDIVNEWKEEQIATIIYSYGEERFSRRIAKKIVECREDVPIETTFQLRDLIESAIPRRFHTRRIHPATKTFQALRIAVNDEIGALQTYLQIVPNILADGGRIAIISFHSIEDRIVKRTFRQWEKDGLGVQMQKRPQTASAEELEINPKSRSAKLRIFTIISTHE